MLDLVAGPVLAAAHAEIGAKAEDIPAMVAHRGEKPGGFPFGGFVEIGPKEMEAVLRLAAEQ